MNPALKYLPARGDRRRHFITPNTKPMLDQVIDLEKELVRQNSAALLEEDKRLDEQRKLDFESAKVEQAVSEAYRDGIMSELGFDYQLAEARRIRNERRDFAALPQNRIMSIGAIRSTCIKYGLRFLPTRYYRGALDNGIGPAVERTKEILGGKLPLVEEQEAMNIIPIGTKAYPKVQFYIAAPQEAFQLQPRPIDPLLFLRLNSLKYFLVHKWGDDLRTGDIRQGQIGEHNWNSPFSDRETRVLSAVETLAMRDIWRLGGANNPAAQISVGLDDNWLSNYYTTTFNTAASP